MGIKKLFFIIFLIGIVIFPFFFSKKEIIIQKKISLPKITLDNAKFKSYNTNLEKKGNFKHLDLFRENYYIINNLNVKFLDKNSSFITKKLIFNQIYNFYNAKYITNNYIYLAKKGTFDSKTKKLIAYNFKFFNNQIIGYGAKMEYFNDIIHANNIKYIIKGIQ